MPSGENYTSNLTDSLNTMVAAARIVNEYEGVMPQLVERQKLEEGTGLTWNEVSFAKLTATNVAETERLNNPQQYTDTNFAVTPTVIGVHTVITDRVRARLAKVAYAKMGVLAQNAIQRKKDADGLLVLDGATNSLGSAGTTASTGLIAAAAAQITGNTTEPADGPIACVVHPFQRKDFYDELVAGVGTYPLPEGPSATVFKTGFKLAVAGVDVFSDGNLTIDSSSDAKGGVFAKKGIVLVEGRGPWKETRREPDLGGGADSIWLYGEYAFGERLAGGSTSAWVFEIYTDATAPTS